MYIRYVLDGEVHSRFLGHVEMPGGTAPEIVDTVLKVLTAKSISLAKLYGVATDGARVMVGCRTGVTTRLNGKNPFYFVSPLQSTLFSPSNWASCR